MYVCLFMCVCLCVGMCEFVGVGVCVCLCGVCVVCVCVCMSVWVCVSCFVKCSMLTCFCNFYLHEFNKILNLEKVFYSYLD
jgi:hypothetical protein